MDRTIPFYNVILRCDDYQPQEITLPDSYTIVSYKNGLEAVMNRFYLCGHKPIYIHTQPWSWKAILLYISLGFRLQKTDTFASYTSQYYQAMETLKSVLSAEQYHLLELASDD